MKSSNLRVDVNKVLPQSLWPRAVQLAILENPGNLPQATAPGTPLELAVHRYKKWGNGRILRIRFLGGHPEVRNRVSMWAQEWTEHANLTFDFGDFDDAEIRISFANTGSWSYIGTDALTIPQDQATMNFGWLEPDSTDEKYAQVVLHEFGHAIGCIHEHQTPIAGIPWNKDAVYDYCINKLNWTKRDVDVNFFLVFDADSTNSSAFDPCSIMIYPILKEFTVGGFEVPWNSRLSEQDKCFIATVYPR